MADFRPDSLVVVDVSAEPGETETITGALVPGNYFLIVVDFPGVPAEYTLTAAVGAGAAGGVGALLAADDIDAKLARLRAKRDAYGPRRPPSLRPRGRQP